MSERVRQALATPGLTRLEQVLMGILASHDRLGGFNPSIEWLAKDLFPGRTQEDAKRETKRVLQSLERKGAAKRNYRERDGGKDDYSHIWILGDDEDRGDSPQTEPPNRGERPQIRGDLPQNRGERPRNRGESPTPKYKRTSKTNEGRSSSGGDSRGNSVIHLDKKQGNLFLDKDEDSGETWVYQDIRANGKQLQHWQREATDHDLETLPWREDFYRKTKTVGQVSF